MDELSSSFVCFISSKRINLSFSSVFIFVVSSEFDIKSLLSLLLLSLGLLFRIDKYFLYIISNKDKLFVLSFSNKISFFLFSSLFTDISNNFKKFNIFLFLLLSSSLFLSSINSFINSPYTLFEKDSFSSSISFLAILFSLTKISTILFKSLYKSKNSG